jgi:cell division protein ZapB
MSEHTLQELSDKLDQLITQCEKLQGDNALLRQREQEWLTERVDLIEKNNQARARVEAVIDNLKSLKEGVV